MLLHSGRRNVGNTMAKYYDNVAMRLLQKQGIRAEPGLNYLENHSREGQE